MHSPQNPHLVIPPTIVGLSDSRSVIIGVHGRGQDPTFIVQLRDRLHESKARWIVPAAAGREWYGHRFMDQPAGVASVAESLSAISALISRVNDEGTPTERITLLGFSQGACLLAQYALMHPRRYAGLLLFTGGYLGRPSDAVTFTGDLAETPTLLAGIDNDPWVPLPRMLETDAQLRRMNASVTLTIEPGDEHGVSDTAIALGSHLLQVSMSQLAP